MPDWKGDTHEPPILEGRGPSSSPSNPVWPDARGEETNEEPLFLEADEEEFRRPCGHQLDASACLLPGLAENPGSYDVATSDVRPPSVRMTSAQPLIFMANLPSSEARAG